MTLRDAAVLVAFVAVPMAMLCGFGYLARWIAGRRDDVDALIHAKGARWRPDGHGGLMNVVDWQKAERAGARRWHETLRAQRRRVQKLNKPAKPAEVRRFPFKVVG